MSTNASRPFYGQATSDAAWSFTPHIPAKTNHHPMTDSWRSWIAENLMLGNTRESMILSMTCQGIPESVAAFEIDTARKSPYLQGARRLQNKLAKREWVLENYQKLARLAPQDVPRKHRLSKEGFLKEHYMTNQPVIITGMLDDWPAVQKWNLDYFKTAAPDAMVEVQFGRNADPDYEMNGARHRKTMRFDEYIDLIQEQSPSNDFYMTANNDRKNKESLAALWSDIGPLSEYLATSAERQGFFWLGPAGTLTPFHHDLTNNFMAQVVGRKKVKIIPAHDITLVPNPTHCFTPLDGRRMPASQGMAAAESPMVLECILEPGEILFLPIGCWHFVESLDVSVTLSFTNFHWNNDFYSDYPEDRDF